MTSLQRGLILLAVIVIVFALGAVAWPLMAESNCRAHPPADPTAAQTCQRLTTSADNLRAIVGR